MLKMTADYAQLPEAECQLRKGDWIKVLRNGREAIIQGSYKDSLNHVALIVQYKDDYSFGHELLDKVEKI